MQIRLRPALVAGCVLVACTGSVAGQVPSVTPSPPALTLDAALDAALRQHPQIEAARAQVAAALGTERGARALPNPVASYWVENVRLPGHGPSAALDRETSFYGTLPVDELFRRGPRVGQARAEVRIAQATLARTEQQVSLDVADAFCQLGLAQAAVAAARDAQAVVRDVVAYVRQRVTQGAAPEGELIRAEVEDGRSAAELALAEADEIRARAALQVLVGDVAPEAVVRVSLPARPPAGPLPPAADLTAHALATRPDVLAGRARVEAAASAMALERAQVIPDFGAALGVKRTAGMTTLLGGITVSVPLFDRRQGQVQRAAAEREAADQTVRWLERMATGEVYAEYAVGVRVLAFAASARPDLVDRADESRRIALGAYQEGAGSLLQVLESVRALGEVRVVSARAAATAARALFHLGVSAGYDARSAATLAATGRLPSERPSQGVPR